MFGPVLAGILVEFGGRIGVSPTGRAPVQAIQVWFGHVMILNLPWRFMQGVRGCESYARWRAILPEGRGCLRALEAYVSTFLVGHPGHYPGRDPAGRLAVPIIRLLLVIQAVTGLVLAGTDLFYPPFGGSIARRIAAPNVDPSVLTPPMRDIVDQDAYIPMRSLRSPFIATHGSTFYVPVAIVAPHAIAVIATEPREVGTIVSARLTGRKIIPKPRSIYSTKAISHIGHDDTYPRRLRDINYNNYVV